MRNRLFQTMDWLSFSHRVLVTSLIGQLIWFILFPLDAGWDSLGYLAAGRWLSGLPFTFWNLYEYYSPGYPALLALSGVFKYDTFEGIRAIHLVMGVLMPYFVFQIVKPTDRVTAGCAAYYFMISTAPYCYSNKIMTDHAALFFLLLTVFLFVRFIHTSSMLILGAVSVSTFITFLVRPINMFLIVILSAAACFYPFNGRTLGRTRRLQYLSVLVVPYMALYFFTCIHMCKLRGEDFRLAVTRDYGARTLFYGAYVSATYFQNPKGTLSEGRNKILVAPENGPATKAIFDGMKEYAKRNLSLITSVDPKLKTLDDLNAYFINSPTQENFYKFWFGLDGIYGTRQSERFQKRAMLEALRAHPVEMFEYYISNFFNYIFGPSRTIGQTAETRDRIVVYRGVGLRPVVDTGFFKEVMPLHIGKGRAFNEITAESPKGPITFRIATFLDRLGGFLFDLRPFLSLVTFIGVFLAGKKTYLPLLCSVMMIYFAFLTSPTLPVQVPYWLPGFPFMICGFFIGLKLMRGRLLDWLGKRQFDLVEVGGVRT